MSAQTPLKAASSAAASNLGIPSSTTTIKVSILDSTAQIVGPSGSSVMPTLPGQSFFNFDTWCFLLEHPNNGQRLLFDGGSRVDWWNLAPTVVESLHGDTAGLRVTKSINQVLQDGGFDDKTIDAVIWSHHHFDHVGDISLFPPSTDVIVGAGFKKEFVPGYPTDPEAPLLDSDFAGRTIREIDFEHNAIVIGGFRAVDFFGDGAIYLLDTPGHALGHLSALVRTTPDTFVFLGGDICDAPQVLRPTAHNPLPEHVDARLPLPCPCSKSKSRPPRARDERQTPFSGVSDSEISYYEDPETSQQSVDTLQVFDANPNVFVALAHDCSLRPVLQFFPEGSINDWKEQGWKEKVMWSFLSELPLGGKPVTTQMIVDGVYRDGEKLNSAEDVLRDLDPDLTGRCNQSGTTN